MQSPMSRGPTGGHEGARISSQNRIYYGWVIVSVSLLNLLILYGIWYSYSVFLVSFGREFGWNRVRASSIFSVFVLVIAFTGPFVGYLLDRFGSRKLLSLGSLTIAAGLFLCSNGDSIAALYITFGVIVGMGGSLIGLVGNSQAISSHFSKKRGLAIGIATSGIGLGMMVIVPIVQVWVSKYGWRSGFSLLSLIAVLILFPTNAILMRDKLPAWHSCTSRENRLPSGRLAFPGFSKELKRDALRIFRDSEFWRIFFIFFSGGFVVQAVLIHQVAIAADAGFNQLAVATALGVLGIVGTIGRTIWGFLSDHQGRQKAFLCASVALILGLCAILVAKTFGSFIGLYSYAFLFGLGYSAIAPLNWTIAADVYSGNRFGFVYGFLFMGTGIGAALGPLTSGFFFDKLSDYDFVFALVGMSLAISNVFLRQVYSKGFVADSLQRT